MLFVMLYISKELTQLSEDVIMQKSTEQSRASEAVPPEIATLSFGKFAMTGCCS